LLESGVFCAASPPKVRTNQLVVLVKFRLAKLNPAVGVAATTVPVGVPALATVLAWLLMATKVGIDAVVNSELLTALTIAVSLAVPVKAALAGSLIAATKAGKICSKRWLIARLMSACVMVEVDPNLKTDLMAV
jgi:hypothetical protein